MREFLGICLKREGHEVGVAESGEQALEVLVDEQFDIIITDLRMPGSVDGLKLLEVVKERKLNTEVVLVTAYASADTALAAMKFGAYDYLTKPFKVDEISAVIARAIEKRALVEANAALRERVAGRNRLASMVGKGPLMQRVFAMVRKIHSARTSVLITGESGTGKELIARALHTEGNRSEHKFVAVNCGAIPSNLMESELFGHVKGAFTGAASDKQGLMRSADKGTLFLDEIGELDPAVQAKLLRALQERTIERVGSHEPIPVDARFVAATNRNLERDVAAGRFREDLYYRIHVVPIGLPPLRERREDIPLLCDAFLAKLAATSGDEAAELTRPARAALERHAWPGNVRELQNALERAVALREGTAIRPEDLPETVTQASRTESLRDAVRGGQLGLEDAASSFEIQLIREALDRCEWNQTRAAEHLGVTRRLLKIKIDRYGIKN